MLISALNQRSRRSLSGVVVVENHMVPQRRSDLSITVTRWPRSVSTRALSSPAGPAPTTTMCRLCEAGFSGEQGFVAEGRVHCAEGSVVEEVLGDAEVAVDAGAHLVEPAVAELVGQFGVGQELPAHGGVVDPAVGDLLSEISGSIRPTAMTGMLTFFFTSEAFSR